MRQQACSCSWPLLLLHQQQQLQQQQACSSAGTYMVLQLLLKGLVGMQLLGFSTTASARRRTANVL
jgi:hypothetical protein